MQPEPAEKRSMLGSLANFFQRDSESAPAASAPAATSPFQLLLPVPDLGPNEMLQALMAENERLEREKLELGKYIETLKGQTRQALDLHAEVTGQLLQQQELQKQVTALKVERDALQAALKAQTATLLHERGGDSQKRPVSDWQLRCELAEARLEALSVVRRADERKDGLMREVDDGMAALQQSKNELLHDAAKVHEELHKARNSELRSAARATSLEEEVYTLRLSLQKAMSKLEEHEGRLLDSPQPGSFTLESPKSRLTSPTQLLAEPTVVRQWTGPSSTFKANAPQQPPPISARALIQTVGQSLPRVPSIPSWTPQAGAPFVGLPVSPQLSRSGAGTPVYSMPPPGFPLSPPGVSAAPPKLGQPRQQAMQFSFNNARVLGVRRIN